MGACCREHEFTLLTEETMLSCSRNETKLIQNGKATSLTRLWADPSPYVVGNPVVLTSRYVGVPEEGEIPFAIATIVSIRPVTVGEMRRDARLCQMDGFRNPAEWLGHLQTRYRGIADSARLVRLQLRIDEMDKDVADRVRASRQGAEMEQVEVG
jgi:hypothetical protein